MLPVSLTLRARQGIIAVLASLLLGGAAIADESSFILQSTTSTANSGLYDYLLPRFRARTGIKVNVVAVGTGQAIKNAKNGDGDVLLVHAKSAEEEFVAQGYGVKRFDVMYNDFILIGPGDDPAAVRSAKTAIEGLQKIAAAGALFASRGDNSGTHKKETALWHSAAIDATASSGKWYRETGSGMGATLNVAVGMNAYTITDRATWISFRNRGNHEIVLQGDADLFNQYGIILVNPDRHARVRAEAGQAFIDWILGTEGQNAIAAYKLGGKQLFFPNAN